VSKLPGTGKTPWQTLGARLFVDIRDNSSSKFIKVGKNPARLFLASRKSDLTPDNHVSPASNKVVKTPNDKTV
jgi:hypothetical protein